MSEAASKLMSQAMDLAEDDRLELASQLIASVDGPADADWDAAWLAELERRSQAAETRGERGSEWRDVRARILARLGRE